MKKPILVTGSHRSGTTWVGRMISLDIDVGYIHEPFNISLPPGYNKLELNYWFTYINSNYPNQYCLEHVLFSQNLQYLFFLLIQIPHNLYLIKTPPNMNRPAQLCQLLMLVC
jgi:hypothetical protein